MTPNSPPGEEGGPPPVRVVGVGSPFGLDRLGWEAVEVLGRTGIRTAHPQAQVSLLCLDRPGAALMETLAAPGLVILIDAMRSGGPPGSVRALDPEDLEATRVLMSTHDFGIESALQLARVLGETACEIRILGIEMGGAGPGEVPETQAVTWETEILIRLVNELIKDFLVRGHHLPGPDLVE